MVENYYCTSPQQWSLSPRYAGQEACVPGHTWSGVRDHYLLHYVRQGRGWVKARGQMIPVRAGESFLFAPNAPITYRADEKDPWRYVWVGFSGTAAGEIVRATGADPARPVLVSRRGGRLDRLFDDLLTAVQGVSGGPPVAAAGLVHLILAELSASESADPSRPAHSGPGASRMVERAKVFIDQNYQREISVADVVSHIGLDRSYLSRRFRAEYGLTIQRYLTGVRMERARRLVGETSLSIGAIAASVGYRSYEVFQRNYRRAFGQPPRATRRIRDSRSMP